MILFTGEKSTLISMQALCQSFEILLTGIAHRGPWQLVSNFYFSLNNNNNNNNNQTKCYGSFGLSALKGLSLAGRASLWLLWKTPPQIAPSIHFLFIKK